MMLGELLQNVINFYHTASILITWSAVLQLTIISFVLYIIYSQFIRFYYSPLNYLPSVPFVPILGSVPELIRCEAGEFGERWMNNLKASVYRYYWLFGGDRVMVCDADVIKGILVNKSKIYQKSKLAYMLLKSLLGDGLVTSEGEIHSRNRKICNTSFRPSVLNKMVPLFEKAGKDLIDMWLNSINALQCDKNNKIYNDIPIMSEMSNLTLDVIGKFAFDYDFHAIQHCRSEVTTNFRKILGEFQLSWINILQFIFPFLRKVRGKYLNNFEMGVEQINEVVYSVIEKKQHELETSTEDSDATNLLCNLLKAKYTDSQEILNDKQLRDEVLTFMLAGHETTSVGMTWILHHLAKYPEIQANVRKEVRSILPQVGEPLTSEHLEKMSYLTCVIKETLRLFPPVPMVIRQAMEDNYIEGYYFPKGIEVNINIISLHRNPKYWEDPLEFRPERFEDPNNIYPYSFIPFIAGSRMCIGHKFALMEMKTVVALLIDKFEFLPLPDVTYRRVMMITMHPEPHLVLKVKMAD